MFTVVSAYCYTVSDKIALEKVYSERLERVLENIIGKDKVFVYVNLELDNMQKQEQRETYIGANESAGKSTSEKKWLFQDNNPSGQYYLPGYPVEQGKNSSASPVPMTTQKIVEQTIESPATVIKRADVTILIEPGIPEETVKPVPRIAAGLLGLNKARGDTISVRRIPFLPSKTLVQQFEKPEIMLDIGKYLLVFIMILLCIFVFLLLSKDFLKNVGVIVQALRPKLEVAVAQKSEENIQHGGEIKSETSIEGKKLPANVSRGGSRESFGEPLKENKHFDFIDEKNIKRLSMLIKNEPAENIALAISYLNPRDASYVLSGLEPVKRSEVTNKLVNTIEASPETVEKIEKNIKNKIDYMLGGNEFMLEVLDFADNATRETLLSDVSSQNLEAAARLRSELFLFF